MAAARPEDVVDGRDQRHEAAAAEAPTASGLSSSEPPLAPSPQADASLAASTTSAASGIGTSSPSHAPTTFSHASHSHALSHSHDGTSSDPTSPPDTDAAQQHHGAHGPAHARPSHGAASPQPEPPSEPLHDSRSSAERTADARAALLATLANTGTHATAPLEQRAADMAANNAALARQEESVRAETAGLARVTAEYAKVADEARGKLKELGHVQNWAEMLERDLLVLEETMRIVDEDQGEEEGGRTQGKGKGKGRRYVGEQDGDTAMHDADIPAEEDAGGHLTASADQAKGQKKGWASWW